MGPHALTAKRLAHHNGARLQSNTHTINKKNNTQTANKKKNIN